MKNRFFVLQQSTLLKRKIVLVLFLTLPFIAPVSLYSKPTQVMETIETVIDTAFPASIPAEIAADWEKLDSGGVLCTAVKTGIKFRFAKGSSSTGVVDAQTHDTAGMGYLAATTNIKNCLLSPFAEKVELGKTREAYYRACHWRRVARIQPILDKIKRIVFSRHYDIGGPTIGYVEEINQSFLSGLENAFNLPRDVVQLQCDKARRNSRPRFRFRRVCILSYSKGKTASRKGSCR